MKTTYGYVDVNDKELFGKINYNDMLFRLRQGGYLGTSHMIDKQTGQIRKIIEGGIEWSTPWVHVNVDDNRNCNELQMIEKCFGFVPTKCLSCWKVVIRPKTVVDLFNLYNLMVKVNEDDDVPCKCGCEVDRPFVHALYGGYVYNTGKQEGEKRLEQWRKLLKEYMPGTDCYLKRYCSEFEIRHGNTKGYNQPKEAKHWETLLDKYLYVEPPGLAQPDYLVNYVMSFWIKTAYYNGDSSVLKLNNDEHLFTQCQKYEKGD